MQESTRPIGRRVGHEAAARRVAPAALCLFTLAAVGCAQLVDADFSEKSVRRAPPEPTSGGPPRCYSGPPETADRGACSSGTLRGQVCEGEVVPTVEDCVIANIDENCDGEAACTGATMSQRDFGNDGEQPFSVVSLTPDGGVVLGIKAIGAVDYGAGPIPEAPSGTAEHNVHLVKLTGAGELVWSKSFGGAGDEDLGGVQADGAGDVVVAGTSTGAVDFGGGALAGQGRVQVFLAKLDASGKHVWSRRFGEELDLASVHLRVAPDRSILLAGDFNGVVDFGGGALTSAGIFADRSDVFVARFTPDGDLSWSRRFGDDEHQSLYNAAINSSGEIVISGEYQGTIDFGQASLSADALDADNFIAKLDASGKHLWSEALKGKVSMHGVAISERGDVFASGKFSGELTLSGEHLTAIGGGDALVLGYDNTGKPAWHQSFGGESAQGSTTVALDAAGHVLVGGDTEGGITFGIKPRQPSVHEDTNAFIAKLDQNGNILWGRLIDGPSAQHTWFLVPDPLGNVLATGAFQESIRLTNEPLVSRGASDVWFARLMP